MIHAGFKQARKWERCVSFSVSPAFPPGAAGQRSKPGDGHGGCRSLESVTRCCWGTGTGRPAMPAAAPTPQRAAPCWHRDPGETLPGPCCAVPCQAVLCSAMLCRAVRCHGAAWGCAPHSSAVAAGPSWASLMENWALNKTPELQKCQGTEAEGNPWLRRICCVFLLPGKLSGISST